jgi:cystathionine beta-synthase/cysteine synthase A
MNISPLLDTIGNTPLVELTKLSPRKDIRILVKLEFLNPGFSIKDRIVRHIIRDAEERGELKPGGTIVENTSGNTGAATAMIGALKGYKVILTMPDKVSLEKQNSLKAYGAEVRIYPTAAAPGAADHYVQAARDIAKELNAFMLNQYDNKKNPEAHYLTTGPEIWEQCGGIVDYYVASGSTGGTVSGVGKYLKEQNPDVKVVMPDPFGSIYYDYWKSRTINEEAIGSYFVEGVGEDHLAKAIDFDVIDEVLQFNDQQAFTAARRLAQEEGILGGGTGGANLWGALQIANRLDKPATIITVIPDSGIKYLSKLYNDEWMHEKGFSI